MKASDVCCACFGLLFLLAAIAPARAATAPTESLDQAICRLIETTARADRLPVAFLTRLVWRESSFRPTALSPKGALGVAQFMPQTAAERGLADPLDPEQAIPQAGRLLAELSQHFGNLGLAAAAYNAGAARVTKWLVAQATLPVETRAYVLAVTLRPAEAWAVAGAAPLPAAAPQSCLALTADLRRRNRDEAGGNGIMAPWDVQLAGNFSKELALISFDRARLKFAGKVGNVTPMIIGARLRSRGTRMFYRVGLPAPSRPSANALCHSIRALGVACVVYRR